MTIFERPWTENQCIKLPDLSLQSSPNSTHFSGLTGLAARWLVLPGAGSTPG